MPPHCKKCFKRNTGWACDLQFLKLPKYGLVPEAHDHNYVHRIDCFESLGWRGVCVFPSLSPSFCPMLHDASCFIAGDDLVQRCSVG